MKIISINPTDNKVIGEYAETAQEQTPEIIEKARKCFPAWRNLDLKKRIEIMTDLYERLKKNFDEICKLTSTEIGKPILQSESEVSRSLDYMKWDLENAEKCLAPEITFESEREIHKVFFEPKGVVLSITPFNYPFAQFIWHVSQNLLVGNVVVNKPDINSPSVYILLEKIVANSKLPKGVLQFVFGGRELGQFLASQNFDMICFTGSTVTGEYLHKVAGEKMIPIFTELGGSTPGIICKDANIEKAVKGVFASRFGNCGQVCHAIKRLIVHESILDKVVKKLTELAKNEIIGDPFDRKTTLGTLVNKSQLEKLTAQVDDAKQKGAKVICGGKQPDGLSGCYYEPTILTNITRDMRVWSEEIFGPVLPIMPFKTIEQAIELGNDTQYGLGAFVYTADKATYDKIQKELDSGMVAHNGISYSTAFNPFGGVKKSGNARVRGKYGFHELCNIKVVTFEK